MFIVSAVVLLILIIWLVSRKLSSYKNDPVILLGLDLEEKKREKRMHAIEKQVALRHALDKGVDPNSYTIKQLIEQYEQDVSEEGIGAAKYPGPDCWEPWQAESYVRGEELMKSNASHLESCVGCQMLVSGMRPDPELQKPPGPDCITEKELEEIRAKGFLSKNQRGHLSLCKRCKSNIYSAQEKFIERVAPNPDPWGMDELD